MSTWAVTRAQGAGSHDHAATARNASGPICSSGCRAYRCSPLPCRRIRVPSAKKCQLIPDGEACAHAQTVVHATITAQVMPSLTRSSRVAPCPMLAPRPGPRERPIRPGA